MSKSQKIKYKNIEIKNRKAFFHYEILEKFVAGMVLKGTEIKSLRESKASIQEAHGFIFKNEILIKGMTIGHYKNSSFSAHAIQRNRKLLLKKKEIIKIKAKLEEKGLTLVPLKIFINERGFAKVSLALAKGKKLHDKREALKRKDQLQEINKNIKNNF